MIHAFTMQYLKGDEINQFSYPEYDLIYIVKGAGTICIEDKKVPYKDQNILLMKPTYIRDQICEEDTEYYCIRFKSHEPLDEWTKYVYTPDSLSIYALFKGILSEYTKMNYKYHEICNLKIGEILLKLSRLEEDETQENTDIYQLVKEIDSTLLYQKSVQEMAQDLNYNYDYFRQKFKSITGHSPLNYIMQKRLENACKLLQQGEYSCTEIAGICGFSSSSQFSKIFKRELGIPPYSYSKINKKGF